MGAPSTPRDLGKRGRKLFRDVVREYDLDPQNVACLHEAARCLDEIELLRAAVDRDGATTTGSTGQIVEHPALAGLRAHRGVFDRLLGRLALPDAEGVPELTPYQKRAKVAHDARWAHGRAERAAGARVDGWARRGGA